MLNFSNISKGRISDTESCLSGFNSLNDKEKLPGGLDAASMNSFFEEAKKIKSHEVLSKDENDFRIFTTAVLKIKFEYKNKRIYSDVSELLLWKEAKRRNIQRCHYISFILQELRNPIKYVKFQLINPVLDTICEET